MLWKPKWHSGGESEKLSTHMGLPGTTQGIFCFVFQTELFCITPLPCVAHTLYDHTIVLQARHTFSLRTMFNMVSELLLQVIRGGYKMKSSRTRSWGAQGGLKAQEGIHSSNTLAAHTQVAQTWPGAFYIHSSDLYLPFSALASLGGFWKPQCSVGIFHHQLRILSGNWKLLSVFWGPSPDLPSVG